MPETIQTLEDLHRIITEDRALPKTRRRDMCSSIRSGSRLLDKQPSDLPADKQVVFRLLKAINPIKAGISTKRFQNITCDLRNAFEFGKKSIITHKHKRNPKWQQLYECLQSKNLQNGLSGFMTFCSRQKINPDDVNDKTALAYFDYVSNETFRKYPKRIHRDICRLWNKAHDTITDWPNATLTVPDNRPASNNIPWEKLPNTYRKDIEEYLIWKSGKNLLMEQVPTRPCKARTLGLLKKHIHGVTSAAVKQGVPIESFHTLADLIKPSTVKLALEEYLERYDQKPTLYIQELAKAILRIASEWVNVPDEHRTMLRDYVKKLNPHQHGLTEKNRNTLRQFDSKDNVKKVLSLPAFLALESKKHKLKTQKAALVMQSAVAIEILLMAPMRASNLAALTLDKSICRPQGKNSDIILVINPDDMKNSIPMEYLLPKCSTALLDNYLQYYRPALCAKPDNQWLFPGRTASHKSTSHLCAQLKQTIYKYTGLTITVHQFRHLAAKLYLDANPGSYELVRRVLGHTSIKTTTNFYTGMETQQAAKHFDRTILNLRDNNA